MRDSLFVAGLLGLTSGILCRSFFLFPWQFLFFMLVVAGIFCFAWLFQQRVFYIVCAVFIIGSVFGAGRVMLAPASLPPEFVPLIGSGIELQGKVIAEPDIRETTQRIRIEIAKDGSFAKVLAVAPLYPETYYGAQVIVRGKLTYPEPFETDTGRTFRYDQFLAKDAVFALVESASIETVRAGEDLGSRIMGTLLYGKHVFQEGLARAIPEPGASLASGLITGGKQGLGTTLLDAFIVAGLVHIVVLSGYNVMIVAEGILRTFAFLPRRSSAILAGLVIALFVLAAGAGAASVRAGLMAGLGLVARATGRTYAVVRALLVVAAVMLLMNPLLLAFDPGFQLSFVATLGLILLAPIIEIQLTLIRSLFWRDLLAATLAAQIAVLPLLLYQTGLFSLVSLPANLLVLPLVPLAMLLSAFAGLIGAALPGIAPFLGLPAHLILSIIISIAEFASSLSLASVSVPQFPFLVTVLSYVSLGFVIAKMPAKTESSRALRH
ncbi:MAG: Competence protein ComEC [Patescibacteria group bacterium]|nr:Competence protein ComEC [Patescibacteria group bacterium]